MIPPGTPATLAKHRPSLRDVARVAGVTPAAVSYVMNGRTDQVGADTLTRIQEAIKAVRYQPQRRGLSLKLNREFAMGLVILDPDPNFLADPFTTQIASGFSNALVAPGYSLMVTGTRSLEDLRTFLARPIGVDAMAILMSGPFEMRQEAYRLIGEHPVPVVVVQDTLPHGIDDGCAILQEDAHGGATLARHLLERGARSFLFVGPARQWPAMERREQGVRSVLEGRHPIDRIGCDEQDYVATMRAIEDRLDRAPMPDAIIGGNDQIAIAVLKALARRGVRVPERVKVTGFNNFVFRNYTTPLLTTVNSAANAMGRKIAEAGLHRLETGAFPATQTELAVSLVQGETT